MLAQSLIRVMKEMSWDCSCLGLDGPATCLRYLEPRADRNEAQLAGHARMEPSENRSQTPRRDETSVQSDMGHTDAKAAISPNASQPSSDFIDELATLPTRLIDVLAGYKAMLEKAEPEIQPIVNEYIDTHELHEKQLAERLTKLGHKADEDGSFFSVVQNSIVRVRSMFTEIGTNTLPQIVDGENSLIDLYRKDPWASHPRN